MEVLIIEVNSEVVMRQFDSITLGSLDIAQAEAMERKHCELAAEHLLYGLISNPRTLASQAFKAHLTAVVALLQKLPTATEAVAMEQLSIGAKLNEWMALAAGHAAQHGRSEVAEDDLLRFLPRILPQLALDYERLKSGEGKEELPPFLINLNQRAEEGKLDPVIGRAREIRAVMEILGRRGKNNPCLVGNAGVGKTAIVEGLALAIASQEVPDVLRGKTVLNLDLGGLMAGTKFRGEFEERIQTLLRVMKKYQGQAILFIDEIHQIVGAGKTDGAMDAANLLKPTLARGELHCIGATTHDEYQKYIMHDSALERRFRSVPVEEPSTEDAVEILMGVREKLEIHHGIKISDEANYAAVFLSDQYITHRYLPDKAIDLVDEAASALKLSVEAMPAHLVEMEAEIRTKMINAQVAKDDKQLLQEAGELKQRLEQGKRKWEEQVLSVKRVSELKNQLERARFQLEQAQRGQDYEQAGELLHAVIPGLEKELAGSAHDWVLRPTHIAQVISRQTGIPVEKILKNRQDHILELEDFLQHRVFGQNAALSEIAETLVTAHAGLSDESRPLGSFLLLGPSGVGKTETAKALAEFLFNHQEQIIRFDMSEFSEKHAVAKLIGAPAGYVGYEEGGTLTEAVRRKPYSVILFDEIEKAHGDFSDILLQVLDDGRLTDNKGRTIDFKNTVLILTSNTRDHEQFFRPEVLGRIDAILHYSKLGKEVAKQVIDKELVALNTRLQSQHLRIEFCESVYELLMAQGINSRYGARPLRNSFQRLVARPLARKLLRGEVSEGELCAQNHGGHLVFQ